MSLPNLPTDNLYKFVALVGVIILIATLYFPIMKAREYRLSMVKLKGQLRLLDIELDYLKEKATDLKSDHDNTGHTRTELIYEAHQLKMKSEELKTKGEELRILELDYQLLISIQKSGMLMGILTGILGFSLWYFKIQRYQDRQLKKNS